MSLIVKHQGCVLGVVSGLRYEPNTVVALIGLTMVLLRQEDRPRDDG
jgi:hypothetical protein